jgi:osmotically inducible lipoprotein OsmB
MLCSRFLFIVAACIALTACGTTPTERGVSGAGIGASAGAVLGAITGLSVLEGAVIGAAAGGLTGALTDNNQINFGDPVWGRGSSSQASVRQSAYPVSSNTHTIRNIQLGLTQLGYNPGPADGIAGAKTRAAIREYQQHYDLLVDRRPTPQLAAHIQGQLGGN